MATPLRSSALLPACTACVRRLARLSPPGLWAWQSTRSLSKKAKEDERNIVVQLLKDMPSYGRAGAYVPINPSLMRNRWFPARVANYVPAPQLKQLKASKVDMARDVAYGVRLNLEEEQENEADEADGEGHGAPKHQVRPIEIEVLSVRHPPLRPAQAQAGQASCARC